MTEKDKKILLIFVFAVFLLTAGFFVFSQIQNKNTDKEIGSQEKIDIKNTESPTATFEERDGKIKDLEPKNLECTIDDFAIKLTWEAPDTEEEINYNVYKKSEEEEDFEKNADGIEKEEYHDKTKTDPYLNYTYYVTSVSSDGKESEASDKVTCKIHSEINKNGSSKNNALKRIFAPAEVKAGSCVAYPSSSFNANKLVSNADFINTNTMTVGKIQKFLEANDSPLATVSPSKLCGSYTDSRCPTKCTNTKTAAELIYEAAKKTYNGKSYGINPGAILVTLQKEWTLITRDTASQDSLDWAMGYTVYEKKARNDCFQGFKRQLLGYVDGEGVWHWGAVASLRNNYNLGRGPYNLADCGGTCYLGDTFTLTNTTGYYCVPSSQDVKPQNSSTMALYRYTPHVFNGNYNFWLFWKRWESWFGFAFSADRSKFATGDVNGDGIDDLVALYKYDGSTTGLWVFEKTSDNKQYKVKRWWLSSKGGWDWARTKVMMDDVNNDGKEDIVLVYKYNSTKIAIWNFISSGSGISNKIKKEVRTPFAYDRSKFFIGDVTGDGKKDVIAFYNYGKTTSALWIFEKTDTGYSYLRWWKSIVGNWSWYNTKPMAGNIDGDSDEDIVLVYKYDNTKIAIWNFRSSGNGISKIIKISLRGDFNLDRFKLGSRDLTGDGKDDIVGAYDYGNSTTGFWVFEKTNVGYVYDKWWQTGKGAWSWQNTYLMAANINGNQWKDLVIVYKYNPVSIGIWNFISFADYFSSKSQQEIIF